MKQLYTLLMACLLVFTACTSMSDTLDLSGKWEVSLDSMQTYHSIMLPGTTDMAGLGTPNTLQPALQKPQVLHLTRKHSFIGAAYYRRTIDVPANMANRPLTLTLERVIWQSRLWIDGVEHPFSEESLATPHTYTIPEGLSEGRHELQICIDNRKRYDISVNELAHAYTEDTQVKWNGILGRMELKAENPVKIAHIATYPDVEKGEVRVLTTVVRTLPEVEAADLMFEVIPPGKETHLSQQMVNKLFDQDTIEVEIVYPLGEEVQYWSEQSPALYTLNVTNKMGEKSEVVTTTFGMRQLGNDNGHLTVNGQRIFLRGTLECCIFPLSGTPPTDDAGWEKIFTAARQWGLNHLRFHSWCPPEAAFRVADRMGFYLQVELPLWSLTVGKDEAMNRFLYKEFDRISQLYGNHPSFCLMSVGNELQPDFDFLNNLVRYMKQKDDRHLYMATTFTFERGHGRHPEPVDDFFVTQWTDNGWVRGQGVFDAEPPCFNKDYREAARDISVPLISHEIGQYAVYPNLKEIEKYTGTLTPLNFLAVKDDLEKKGLIEKADSYLQASGRLAALLYKEEIERAMKTPQFSGFQLLDLHDFPGQGTALVGLLDAFWDSKGVAEADWFRQFSAPVVPLTRFAKATYKSDEPFTASVEIANYSGEAIKDKQVIWMLKKADGELLAEGILPAKVIENGTVTEVGELQTTLSNVKQAAKLTLQVSIADTNWKNSWNIWVYPPLPSVTTENILLTQHLEEALQALQAGGTVLLSPDKNQLKGLEGKFLPVFWSPVHFPRQAGTMGLLCDPSHPALAHFPTDMHSDWQWWHLMKNSRVLVIDSLPPLQPIVEQVDNFANNRRLASLFEARVGKGRLLMSAISLLGSEELQPEQLQMRYSLLKYMTSEKFAPATELTPEQLKGLFRKSVSNEKGLSATSIYE